MQLIQKKGFSQNDFKAIWPRNGHAASREVQIIEPYTESNVCIPIFSSVSKVSVFYAGMIVS